MTIQLGRADADRHISGSKLLERPFDFNDLFVLDMANNHQGDVAHGVRIISEMAEVVGRHDVKGLIKFQFRQLDSFIHPDHVVTSDNKHIPRFCHYVEFNRLQKTPSSNQTE